MLDVGLGGQVRVEPFLEPILGDDYRGPVVDVSQRVLGGGSQDGAAQQPPFRSSSGRSGSGQNSYRLANPNNGSFAEYT
ncbi:hypothetical protein J2Y41_004525 [Arthrobacter sp. 1088]|uniref:hypothetical protein n=1 Tax=Arthrobacter sp. 1088 TaxID=2817768 RepID=UPI0028636A45|nr:hypothetical protein [Arthrobacter sp. 1088]MDR6688927.1 hypothetical protein [Arthrobacter sp. 1088]